MNKLKKLFKLSGLFVTIFTLNSCSWLECKAKGIILVRTYGSSAALQSNLGKPPLTFDEIFEKIKSPEIIDSVIHKMNQNQEYQKFLLNTNLSNKFELKRVKNSSSGVLTMTYRHPDVDFSNAIVTTWAEVVRRKIRDKYKPKEVSLEQVYKDSYSDKTIDNIIANLNKYKKYQSYLSKDELALYFTVTRHHNPDTFTVEFEHPDIEFSNKFINAWRNVMSKNHDFYTWFSRFSYKENIADTGSISIRIEIADEYLDYISVIKYPDGTCSKPNYLFFN